MTRSVAKTVRAVLLAAMSLVLVVTAGGYWILSNAHKDQLMREAEVQLRGMMDSQESDFTQELVNDRFFAIKFRGEALQRQYANEKVEVGLYRPDGTPLFETPGAGAIMMNSKRQGYALVTRDLVYSREVIGRVMIAKPLVNIAGDALRMALYLTLMLQVLAFTAVFVVTQLTIRRSVVVPLQRIISGIPSIKAFVGGQKDAIDVPEALGSTELDEVAAAIRESGVQLRTATAEVQATRIAAERHEAIARTTQMIAHDVRKPFSLLKLGLDMLRRENDPTHLKGLAESLVPEVGRAMQSINGMLSDIMELGVEGPLETEACCVEDLVSVGLVDVFRDQDDADITLEYEFGHKNLVAVNPGKIGRVFTNIIDNAQAAMGRRGVVWFRTREVEVDGRCFVEVTIGNSNSFIAPVDLPRIFDTFFTKGKSSGTGLGLAIAAKVVKTHGGTILCESSRAVGTEFTLTLPVAPNQTEKSRSFCHEAGLLLPQRARDIRDRIFQIPSPRSRPAAAAAEVRTVNGARRGMKVVVVDDNPFVLSAWQSQKGIQAETFASLDDFQDRFQSEREFLDGVECVVTDYYLGEQAGGSTGMDVLAVVRALAPELPVFLATDAMLPSDITSQADGLLGKVVPTPSALRKLVNERR